MNMDWVVPLLILTAGFALISVLGYMRRWLFFPLGLAYVARLAMVLVNNYIFRFPQGASDAMVFDQVAKDWAKEGCINAFGYLDPSASYFYSGLLSVFYGCMAPSQMAAQILNAVAGTLSVAFFALAASRMWGVSAARTCAFMIALFPALLVYSAVTLRESFLLLFFSAAVYATVRYSERKNLKWLFLAVAMLLGATLFHGGMAFGIFGLVSAAILQRVSIPTIDKNRAFQRIFLTGSLLIVIGGLSVVSLDKIFIPKIGNLAAVDSELISDVVSSRAEGNAAYLTGLSVTSIFDIVWQAPIRMVYLLFAPFPWNISSPSHLLGLVDGSFYLAFTVLAIRHRKELRRQPAVMLIAGMLLALTLVYAYGTSNFGTAMRHRAKFYVAIVLIGVPLIHRRKMGLRIKQ